VIYLFKIFFPAGKFMHILLENFIENDITVTSK